MNYNTEILNSGIMTLVYELCKHIYQYEVISTLLHITPDLLYAYNIIISYLKLQTVQFKSKIMDCHKILS